MAKKPAKQGKDKAKKPLTSPAPSGTHQPDCGQCGGKVTSGSCESCGADMLGPKNVK
jgi:hypothetical protein